jgi:hypothetical protein
MCELGLPLHYFLALLEAIQQGRWRTAKNPRAYVKTVAKREAAKMGLDDKTPDGLVLIPTTPDPTGRAGSRLEVLASRIEGNTFLGDDGVWRGGGFHDDQSDEARFFDTFRDYLMSDLPKDLISTRELSPESKAFLAELNSGSDGPYVSPAPLRSPNWGRWCAAAGFDAVETEVVMYRCSGVSRERSVAAQPDESSRKPLQAAWKRFDRNGGERLRAALKKFPPPDVPEW